MVVETIDYGEFLQQVSREEDELLPISLLLETVETLAEYIRAADRRHSGLRWRARQEWEQGVEIDLVQIEPQVPGLEAEVASGE